MRAWMPSSKLMHRCASASPFFLYAGSSVVLATLFLVWYLCIFNTIDGVEKQLTGQRTQMEAEIYSINTIKKQCAICSKKITAEQSRMRTIAPADTQVVIASLINQSEAAGITLCSCVPSSAQKKKWYAKTDIACSVRGSFAQIMQWLDGIQHTMPHARCAECTVRKIEESMVEATCLFSCMEMNDEHNQ